MRGLWEILWWWAHDPIIIWCFFFVRNLRVNHTSLPFSLSGFLCRQSLDSSCDMVCLKERIQKSQEEREKREERLLQTQTLQQTGTTTTTTTDGLKLNMFPLTHDVYLERYIQVTWCETWAITTHQPHLWTLCFPPLLSSSLFLDMEEEEEMICFSDPSRFITDPDFCYQEFTRREEDHFQVFRVQVRTWYFQTHLCCSQKQWKPTSKWTVAKLRCKLYVAVRQNQLINSGVDILTHWFGRPTWMGSWKENYTWLCSHSHLM